MFHFLCNSYMFWCNSVKTNKQSKKHSTTTTTKKPNIWKPEWQHKNARNSSSSNGHSWMVLKVGQSQVKTHSFTELKSVFPVWYKLSCWPVDRFPFITTALIVGGGLGCLDWQKGWHLATSVLLFLLTEFGLPLLLIILSFLSHAPLRYSKMYHRNDGEVQHSLQGEAASPSNQSNHTRNLSLASIQMNEF